MKFALRSLLVCVLSLGALLGSANFVSAQYDPSKLPAAKKALAAFTARAKGSEKTGEVPRLTDPAAMPLLNSIFDTRDLEAAPVPYDSLSPLSERMLAGNQAGLIYMLAGTGASDINQISSDPEAGEKINLNVIKYPDEMGRYFDFAVTMQGAIAESVSGHLISAKPAELAQPKFQSGLAEVRAGGARTVSGVIETLAVNGLTVEWIRARIPALLAVAPKMKKLLVAEQREDMRKLAIACADVTDDALAKKGLQDFAAAVGGP